jgi:hypothetical protein
MERESLEYKIAMDDDPDTEVVGRLAHLDLVPIWPSEVIPPQHHVVRGERIIKRHDGEPKP